MTSPSDQLAISAARERRARWVVLGLIVGVLALYWGGIALFREESAAGIQALPAPTRRQLYVDALNELDTICRGPAAAAGTLHDHCIDEARLILQLPECAAPCRLAALAVLPHARR
jgi:hypothetical protein